MATPDPGPDALRALHAEVDAAAAVLVARHGDRLRCRLGCSGCCVDGITVFEVEAERIRREAAGVLREAPHPPGACAFLSPSGACRIYAARPYVCRTQGLPLRWVDADAPGVPVERRDVCPLNDDPAVPLERLGPDACWEIGPVEGRLATLEALAGGGALRRVALRSLFEPGAAGRPAAAPEDTAP